MGTRMYPFDTEDTLETIGVAAGVFVGLVALGTLLGQPWRTSDNPIALLLQLLGILATVGVAVFLVWISRPDGFDGLRPERSRD